MSLGNQGPTMVHVGGIDDTINKEERDCHVIGRADGSGHTVVWRCVKAVLFVGTPLPKTSLEQTCADYRIAREKGIASRLNDV